jgi:hypothetical protein
MFKFFADKIGGVMIELSGNVVTGVLDKDKKDNYTWFLPDARKCEENISSFENFVRLTGTLDDGVTVEVLEHLYQDNKMGIAEPFFNRNGVKEYSVKNDLYVIFRKEKVRQIYVICHRYFQPLERTRWETGNPDLLPMERVAKKPLVQHMDLSAIPIPESAPKPEPPVSPELAQAIAESAALKPNGKGNGQGKQQPVQVHT